MNYKIEKQWKYKDYTCVVIVHSLGHRCGYVGITEDHPLYGYGYNEHCEFLESKKEELKNSEIGKRGIIPLFCWDGNRMSPEIYFDVHGGLTYSGDGGWGYPVEKGEWILNTRSGGSNYSFMWWFGYDCGHAGDGRDYSIVDMPINGEWVISERSNAGIYDIFFDNLPGDIVRSLEYCIKECENLVDQLCCFQKGEN